MDAAVLSDRGPEPNQALMATARLPAGPHKMNLKYPDNLILPSGQSKVVLSYLTWDAEGRGQQDELIALRFNAWDQDQAVTGRLVPFIVGVVLSVVAMLVTLLLRGSATTP